MVAIQLSTLKLRHVEYFIAVAEAGSITAAAQQLHMTQPPLSQAIAGLERDLGVELFSRQPRGVRLTAAGQTLLEEGASLLDLERRVVKLTQDVGRGLKGSLALAATPAAWWFQLPGLLKQFSEELPDVDLVFADAPPKETLARVTSGRAHFGFVATADPARVADSYPELEVLSLVAMPLVLAVPESTQTVNPASIIDFIDRPWIIPASVPGFPGPIDIFYRLWNRTKETHPQVWEVSTLQSAIPLVADGMGVALMPDAVRNHVSPRVRTVDLVEGIEPLHSAAIWRKDQRRDGAFGAFLNFLTAMGRGKHND